MPHQKTDGTWWYFDAQGRERGPYEDFQHAYCEEDSETGGLDEYEEDIQ